MSFIKIEKPSLKTGKVTSKLSVSNNLKKYIKNSELFIEYDDSINTDESILNIPLTATVLPLAWLTGANLRVGSLNRTFKNSMDQLQQKFSELYPLGRFNTKILAQNLVENKIDLKDSDCHTGILFSGGVDSTYSLYKNLHLRPKLIMFWGVDNFPYPERHEYWTETISTYKKFAEKLKLELYVVKTNISEILHNKRIAHRFHKELYDGNFRMALQHSLVLLPLAAPLSFDRFDRLFIAASGTAYIPMKPRAARPIYDEKIIWADLKVNHHGFISRNQKVQELKDFIEQGNVDFKVCLKSVSADGNLNDSTCEKCLRTIISLVLAGIDPNICGFKVDESTFISVKNFWLNRKTTRTGHTWREIQELIPENIDFDIYGSKKFLEWYREFDFTSSDRRWFYTDLYMSLPFTLSYLLDHVYRKIGINVHENPKKRVPPEKIQSN